MISSNNAFGASQSAMRCVRRSDWVCSLHGNRSVIRAGAWCWRSFSAVSSNSVHRPPVRAQFRHRSHRRLCIWPYAPADQFHCAVSLFEQLEQREQHDSVPTKLRSTSVASQAIAFSLDGVGSSELIRALCKTCTTSLSVLAQSLRYSRAVLETSFPIVHAMQTVHLPVPQTNLLVPSPVHWAR